jgi:TolB-like protein/tetratricopeptide (TPR) repeat protein
MDDHKIYAFDRFTLDPRERRLTHAGHPVALAPKVLDTLIVLVQNAGRLLSKQELHRHLWPDTFVEDVTLARSISDLRTALGLYSESKYIETVAKHGYRFASHVDVSAHPSSAAGVGASDMPPSTRKGLMIAVLPFAPLNDDNSVQIFGDGLAEEIVHALSSIRGLMVAACGSSFQFRGAAFDLRKIAGDLGTELILHGTVRRSGSVFHVTAQLVETTRFTIRWSEHYQKESADLFDLQNSIAKVIVSELKPELNGAELKIKPLRHSNQTEAWHSLWEGRLHQHRFTPEGLAHAERCFEKAIRLDPNYALPYLGVASNQFIKANLAHVCPNEVLPRASDAISRALLLEKNSGDVHAAAGMNQVFWRYNWVQAEIHFLSALALSPSSSSVHHLYALWWLRPQGRFKDAIAENQLALDLDPLSPFLRVVQGYLMYLAGEDGAAVSVCEAALNFDENNFLAHRILGHILQKQGKALEANRAYARAVELPGSSPIELGYLAVSYALLGDIEKASRIQAQLQIPKPGSYLSSTIMAMIDLSSGRPWDAQKRIEKAVKEHDPNLFTIPTDPIWRAMKGLRECQSALWEIGLVTPGRSDFEFGANS